MDSRVLHIAYSKALASVAWETHGEHEYVLVGDGVTVDEAILQDLINSAFSVATLWSSPSRHRAISVPREEAAHFMATQLVPHSSVILADESLHTFVELNYIGVARTGQARANYSFQQTRYARR